MMIVLRHIMLQGNGAAKMIILYKTEEFDVSIIMTLTLLKTPNFGQKKFANRLR